jgi:hypothetical protein
VIRAALAGVLALGVFGYDGYDVPVVPVVPENVLDSHLLVTWYGNPHTARMGILGAHQGPERAAALREQAAAYEPLTDRRVLMAYHLVAVIAQAQPGSDGLYRRREFTSMIRSLLDEARANGFKLVLDIQPGRSTVADEVEALRPFLAEPDVYLALDPEFAMKDDQVPGQIIGSMPASEVNDAIDFLDQVIREHSLPPKVLIVHQFTWNMLPEKNKIEPKPGVEVVLDMDGFGPQALKRSTYRSILRQGRLPYLGFKLFYQQDTNVFTPAQVLALDPVPAVVIYQ